MAANYLSWRSENEFIDECGQIVVRAIIKKVQDARYYAIITDGTPDVSHTEQINFVLRFVHRDVDSKNGK